MNKRGTQIFQGNLKPAEPGEWSEAHAAIEEMIRAGDMEQAHLKLLELVKVYYETAEYWLLLAWTAPDFPSAEAFFTRLVCRFPNHPKATGEVPWSGKAWVQAEVIGAEAPPERPQKEVVAQQKKEVPRADGAAQPKWATMPLRDEIPAALEVNQPAVTDQPAATGQPIQAEDPAKAEQAAPASLAWGNTPVSEREARWLIGIIPGTDEISTLSASATEEEKPTPAEPAPDGWHRSVFDAGVMEWLAEAEQPPTRPADDVAGLDSMAGELSDRDVLNFDAGVMLGMEDAEPTPARQASGAGEAGTLTARQDEAQPAESALQRLLAKIRRINFASVLVVYMAGITLAELLTSFASPHLGLVVHGALLVLILAHSAVKNGSKEQRFLLALGMAPLIRLMSLSMPLLNFDFVYWYMIIGIPLLAAAGVVFRLSGYKAAQVGLAWGKVLPAQLVIGLSGLGLGLLEYLILKPEPLVESFSLRSIWQPALILLIFTGFLEELIFRGLMQRASENTLKKYGALYISLLFAVLHIGYKSWIDLVFVFLVGWAFSIVVAYTRSLAGVTLAHGLTNISLFLVFPFLVSLQSVDILPSPVQPVTGPALWSGSSERQPLPVLRPRVTASETPLLATPTDTLVASPLPGLVTPVAPVSLPSSASTATFTVLPKPTSTATRVVLTTVSASPTPTTTPSPTATPSPTGTPSPTATTILPPTATATATPIPTDDLPVEPTPTASDTPVPTDDLPVEPTPTASETLTPAEPVIPR